MQNLRLHTRRHAGRLAAAVILLALTACSQLSLPPGDGTSLAERRRMLGEDAAGGITVIPKRPPEKATGQDQATAVEGSAAESAAEAASDAQNTNEFPPTSGRTMGEAKKLSSPELGIRLPIGQPALTPRQYAPQE